MHPKISVSALTKYLFVFLLGLFFGMQINSLVISQGTEHSDMSHHTNFIQPSIRRSNVVESKQKSRTQSNDDNPDISNQASEQLPNEISAPLLPNEEKASQLNKPKEMTSGGTDSFPEPTKRWKKHGRDWRLKDLKEQRIWQQLSKQQEQFMQDPPKVYDDVVIVSKVHSHWPHLGGVIQNLCLVNAAYNFERAYPWIIFTSVPWSQKAIDRVTQWAKPANVSIIVDSPPLEKVMSSMTESEQEYLKERCVCCHNGKSCCKHNETLGWDWWCHETSNKGKEKGHATLSYLWQAEFRATHLWTHPALANYKYMIWIDTDAMPTKPWSRDPIKAMVENDLVVMYDNFPQGYNSNHLLTEKMRIAYGNDKAVCGIFLNKNGTFATELCGEKQKAPHKFGLIHGMFHITNLDHYRKPENLKMNQLLTEHKGFKFSRTWDDQIAVTVVPAVTAPDRAWDMRRHGFNMSLAHNGHLDGKEKNLRWAYTVWWKYYNHTWPLGSRMCSDVITFSG